jgi:inosose dehydratase
MQLGIGAWRWGQHYGRRLKRLEDHYDEALASVKAAGASCFEPFLSEDAADRERLGKAMDKHGLALLSAYRNVRLHEPGAEASFDALIEAALWAKARGAQCLTINAEPLAWGKPLDKTDDQLRLQGRVLRALCSTLSAEGVQVAYHIHDAELRHGARELHAMLAAVPAALMGFCFDPQWVHRGCGGSQVAVETLLSLYGERLACLHLRQTQGGIFTESFQQGGDIDFAPIAAYVQQHCPNIPVYIEQGWEPGTPETLSRTDADQRSIAEARELFGS